MLNDSTPQQTPQELDDELEFTDIYTLTPPPSSSGRSRRREQHPSVESIAEHFSAMPRDINAMVVADSANINNQGEQHNMESIGEEEFVETNPLAIVPDNYNNPITSPARRTPLPEHVVAAGTGVGDVPVHVVKKEEVESKICAWQTAEIAKVNNRLKREEVMINGWESEQVGKATAWLNKVERKLDEQRAKAIEKMQNDVAKARRKAEEKRASAEAKRGVKVAKVLELCNMMRAVGRAPSKRSFF